MAGDDRVRHCAECNLNVYNFAAMCSTEVEELMSNREGRLCARLYQRHDGTLITTDCPIGFRVRIQRISRVAAMVLTAVNIGSNVAFAQTPSAQSPSQLVQIEKKETGITVKIHDYRGTGVGKVKISFKDAMGKKHNGTTDKDGNYNISGLEPGEYKLKFKAADIPSWEQKVTLVRDEIVVVNVNEPEYVNVGVLVD